MPQQRYKTQTMWPLATHGLPTVQRRRGRASHLTDMRAKWKQKKTIQIRSKYKLVKANVNSWMSFFEVGENNGRQKAQYLPFMIELGIVIRYGKLRYVQPQPCEPSTEPVEDYPPPLEQHVQLVKSLRQ
jgi:carboxylesterase type B